METKKIKELFGKIERLSVDTQPMRNLLHLLQTRQILVDPYIPTLEALSLILGASNSAVGNKATKIGVILLNLQNKLDNRSDEPINNNSNTTKKLPSSVEKDMIILSALVDIKKDLDTLKAKQTVDQKIYVTTEATKVVEDTIKNIELDTVFVKPNMDTSDIISSVSVESKTESNITDKLNRLKQLKKGGTN